MQTVRLHYHAQHRHTHPQDSGKNQQGLIWAILEPVGSSAPKVPKGAKSDTFVVTQESTTALTCPGQSYPAPAFRFDRLMKLFCFSKILFSGQKSSSTFSMIEAKCRRFLITVQSIASMH